jgi:hypothetical protein
VARRCRRGGFGGRSRARESCGTHGRSCSCVRGVRRCAGKPVVFFHRSPVADRGRALGIRSLQARPAGELPAHVRHDADRVPGRPPSGQQPCARPDVRHARVHASRTPHVSRRRAAVASLGCTATIPFRRDRNDHHRQHAAVGARPGRSAGLLYAEARHGGAQRRHGSRARELPLADRRSQRPAGRRRRAHGHPGPTGHGRRDGGAGS